MGGRAQLEDVWAFGKYGLMQPVRHVLMQPLCPEPVFADPKTMQGLLRASQG